MPIRRWRWRNEDRAATRAFGKDATIGPTDGPAIAFGEFSSRHGLGRAAAYDLELARQRHSHLELVDLASIAKAGAPRKLTFARPVENAYFLCQPDGYRLIAQATEPDFLARAYRIGRWVWETERFPESWRFAESLVHEVWAPSGFCARTFRGALKVPVRIVPHLVSTPPDPGIDMRARFGVAAEAFLGLAVMDIVSCPERKNPWDHIRTWRTAFADDDDKVLVMKLRVGKRTRLVLEELRELIGDADNVKIVVDELENDEIAALHRAADVYLSLHRSEGFGLNIYEALLLGKPTVATDWSANAEYGPGFANYHPVKYELRPYRDWLGHYSEGDFSWASADIADAARQLRQCASRWRGAAGRPERRSCG